MVLLKAAKHCRGTIQFASGYGWTQLYHGFYVPKFSSPDLSRVVCRAHHLQHLFVFLRCIKKDLDVNTGLVGQGCSILSEVAPSFSFPFSSSSSPSSLPARDRSGHRRTPNASCNCQFAIAVAIAGPQLPVHDRSGHCRTSTTSS